MPSLPMIISRMVLSATRSNSPHLQLASHTQHLSTFNNNIRTGRLLPWVICLTLKRWSEVRYLTDLNFIHILKFISLDHLPLSHSSPTAERDPRWVEYQAHHPSAPLAPQGTSEPYLHRPQAQYHLNDDSTSIAGPSRVHTAHPRPAEPQSQSNNIALPTPPRSPPLIEDPPKKPLTLACLFCRKRKIACGSPPPGSPNRTCKCVLISFSLASFESDSRFLVNALVAVSSVYTPPRPAGA